MKKGKVKKHRVLQVEAVAGEIDSGYLEVIARPRVKTNTIPGKICLDILMIIVYFSSLFYFITSAAKLFMLEMIDLLNTHCRVDEMELCYTDTGDSLKPMYFHLNLSLRFFSFCRHYAPYRHRETRVRRCLA